MINSEHPFAPYVRLLGKGKTGSRSLSFDEARDAMSMILRGEAEDVQIGAFLMLLRVKEESAEEIAGFVSACREYIQQHYFKRQDRCVVAVDWSSYAGKRRQPPWYLLATALLAENGIDIVMHGARGHTEGRVYSEDVLRHFGATIASSPNEVAEALQAEHFAFVPLASLCPPLAKLIELRPLFGLRSPVHTLCRLLNPFAASLSLQSVFHPAYIDTHHRAAMLLGEKNTVVFKGESGEVEYRPQARVDVKSIVDGKEQNYSIAKRTGSPNVIRNDVDSLLECWYSVKPLELTNISEQSANSPEQDGALAAVGTAAIALYHLKHADSFDAALTLASKYWKNRNRRQLYNHLL